MGIIVTGWMGWRCDGTTAEVYLNTAGLRVCRGGAQECVCVCVHARTSGHVCSVCGEVIGSPVSVSDCKICSTIS